MRNPLILSLLAGFFFGLWPVIARSAGLPSYWIAFLIPLGTLLVVSIVAIPRMLSNNFSLSTLILIGLVAGAVNGLGMLAYGRVLANGNLNVSKYVPIVAVVSIAAAAIGAFVVFKEPITLQKATGLIAAAIAVWLLS